MVVVCFCAVDGIVLVNERSLEHGISMLSQYLASHRSSKVFSTKVKNVTTLDEVHDPRTPGEDLKPTVMGLAMDTSGVDQVQQLSDNPHANSGEVKVGDPVATTPKRLVATTPPRVSLVTTTSSRAGDFFHVERNYYREYQG